MDASSGRKICEDNEDHIDNMLIRVADTASPFFKQLNYTANGITTLSLIMSLASIYYLLRRDMSTFSIYYLVAYFFDVMDGFYARKYKIFSDFGDKYDHMKDIAIGVIIVIILYDHYEIAGYPVVLCVMIGLIVLMTIYLGCQETLADKDIGSDILNKLSHMSKDKCVQNMKIYRLFGVGTFQIATLICVWYLSYQYDEKYSIDITRRS